MKIVTDDSTSFMEPMTEEQLVEYAEFVVSQMDDEKIITKEGMEFITREDNIPCEADQDRIMELVEELYSASQESNPTEPTAEADSEAGEGNEPASEEEAETESEAPVETAEAEATTGEVEEVVEEAVE